MSERNRRKGSRSTPRAARRNVILPAPGFMDYEDGQMLRPGTMSWMRELAPEPMPMRPSRPGSGYRRSYPGSQSIWVQAAQGPSVN